MNRQQFGWLIVDLFTMWVVAGLMSVIFHIGVTGAFARFVAQVIFFLLFLLPLYRKQ